MNSKKEEFNMKRNHIFTAILLGLLLTLAVTVCACAAEIRPIPLDHDTLDLNNGMFCLLIRGGDGVEKTGSFIAVLYKVDRYDGEQIRAMAPGDTVYVDDRKWTVKEVKVLAYADDSDEPIDIEVYPEEDLGEDAYLGFMPGEDEGTYVAVMGDWNPVTLAGSVKVMLPLPDAFTYNLNDEEQDTDTFIANLASLSNPYNTLCFFRDGQLIWVNKYDYPHGPQGAEDGEFRETPVWKFCHGFRDGLDTAVITASKTDCEEGPIPVEITPEEAEGIRQLAMNGTVIGKANDMSVTGGTWVYSFETPGGTHLLSVELYEGLIVAADGMYSVER